MDRTNELAVLARIKGRQEAEAIVTLVTEMRTELSSQVYGKVAFDAFERVLNDNFSYPVYHERQIEPMDDIEARRFENTTTLPFLPHNRNKLRHVDLSDLRDWIDQAPFITKLKRYLLSAWVQRISEQ